MPLPAVEVVELHTLDDLNSSVRLIKQVFGPNSSTSHPALLRQIQLSGNYLAGAFIAGRPVGVGLGWLGRHGQPDHLHSALVAVDPDVRDRGVGFRLKQHQRLWTLEREVSRIEWTFNPLLARNAYFNLCKLGAGLKSYLQDPFDPGEDRLVVSWILDSERAHLAAAGVPERLQVEGSGSMAPPRCSPWAPTASLLSRTQRARQCCSASSRPRPPRATSPGTPLAVRRWGPPCARAGG